MAAPAALSLITVTFPEGKQRTRALSIYAAMTGMGGGVGLLAGGLLTTYASWRWVFFVNVPLGMMAALGARAVIPETIRHRRRWDIPGALTGTAAFALLVYGLTRAATGPDDVSHWGDAATLIALAGAAISLGVFIAVERRTIQPLMPLRIFSDRNRAGVYLILLSLAAAFFGMFFFLTQFTQVVWRYSPLKGGLAYLPFIGVFIVVAGICSKAVTRVGARAPMTLGALIAPGAMWWLSRVGEHGQYVTSVMLPLMLFAAAAGCIFVPLTSTLVAGVPEEDSGVASSMFNAGQQVGGALGLASIGSAAWTTVNNHLHAGTAAGYSHALAAGVHNGLAIGAATTLLALAVTLVAIRVRKEDLPAEMVVL